MKSMVMSVVVEVLVTCLLIVVAGFLGYVGASWFGVGSAMTGMLLMFALILLRHATCLWQLIYWSRAPHEREPLTAMGAWGELSDLLYQQMRKASKETKLANTELERLRLAAEALPEGVVILDDDWVIEWMNWEAEACLGLSASTDTGSRLTHLLREPALLDYLNAKGTHEKPLSLTTQRNPGRTLQVKTVPFAAERTLIMVRDITQLEKLATMRRDFVANVSHELKTPLTVTLGFIETAADALHDASSEELASYLRMATEQALRMQSLIEDLLMLSSLETDALPQEEAIDIGSLLTQVKQEAQALSDARASQHQISLQVNGSTHIVGSARELQSALSNLATNAVRYTPTGGVISLLWEADAHSAHFSVADTGIGIAAEHLPRLTERFYRVDHGRSRDMGGTGLGLAIVKHVLERHQAQLEIKSELGKGSTFSVAFPAHRVVAE